MKVEFKDRADGQVLVRCDEGERYMATVVDQKTAEHMAKLHKDGVNLIDYQP